MKATELLEKIRENLKDYPIDYLKNKATDDRYPDSITKRLAIYNSGIYDEIYGNEIEEDFEIRELSLYLVLIAKKPLHPFGDNPQKDNVYLQNGEFKCKSRITSIKDERSLCRYCVCKNAGFSFGFM